MEKSKMVTEITKALLAAQKEIGTLFKNKTVKAGSYDYKYADLAAVIDLIKEPLNNHDIVFLQSLDTINAQAVVETVLMHTSGEFFSSKTPVYGASQNPQAFGSGVSYAKRYALLALLGLPTEDDDGNKAGKEPKKEKKPLPKPNELQQAFINEIYDGLCQGEVPDGMEVDKEKLARAIYIFKGNYLSTTDETVIGKSIAYFTNKIADVCTKAEPKPETPAGDHFPYWCNSCQTECVPSEEGKCQNCGSKYLITFKQHREEAHKSIEELRKGKDE